MRESVIVSAVRTPTGKFLGGLKSFTAPLNLQLQFNKLVESEPSPGDLRVRNLVREMEHANRAGP